MINFSKTTLDNGLKIITAPITHTNTVSVLFLIGAGSRYETTRQNGLSHFLEHMFFKGTQKRPTSLDISRELDAVGANYNAFTAEEYTGFYVRVEKTHFPLALNILSDIIFNSKFSNPEIDKEKGVILEELNMYRDIPQRHVQDLAKKLLYGDTSLGRSTVGTKKTITSFASQNFISYRDDFYTPNNMLVAIAGAGSQKNWLKAVKDQLGHLPKTGTKNYEKVENSQKKPELLLEYKKTDQTHVVLGFKSFSRTDPRQPVLQLINNILGDTMSSRLFTEIREKRGLAYYVSSDIWQFHETGAIQAALGADTKRAKEAIKVVLEEFKQIKEKGVTASELTQAKENFKGRLYLELEESFAQAEFLAEQQLLKGKIKTPEELLKEIYKVSSSDIIKVAREIFKPENLNLTIIGPYKDKKLFEKILKI